MVFKKIILADLILFASSFREPPAFYLIVSHIRFLSHLIPKIESFSIHVSFIITEFLYHHIGIRVFQKLSLFNSHLYNFSTTLLLSDNSFLFLWTCQKGTNIKTLLCSIKYECKDIKSHFRYKPNLATVMKRCILYHLMTRFYF
jgi:hypothetical protein